MQGHEVVANPSQSPAAIQITRPCICARTSPHLHEKGRKKEKEMAKNQINFESNTDAESRLITTTNGACR